MPKEELDFQTIPLPLAVGQVRGFIQSKHRGGRPMKRTMAWGQTLLVVIGLVFLSNTAWAEMAGMYTVKRGDSLWKIGKRHSVPWQRIAEENKIAAPYTIYPEKRLTIPDVSTKAPVVAPQKGRVRPVIQPKQSKLNWAAKPTVTKTPDCPRGRNADGYCPYVRIEGDSFQQYYMRVIRQAKTKEQKIFEAGRLTREALEAMQLGEEDTLKLFLHLYLFLRDVASAKEPLLALDGKERAELQRRRAELKKSGRMKTTFYDVGQKFDSVLFGSLKVRHKMVGRWMDDKKRPHRNPFTGKPDPLVPAFEFVINDGRPLALIIECWNLAWLPPVPKPIPEVSKPPTIPGVPTVALPPGIPITPSEALRVIDYDLWLSTGGVHGNGGDTFFHWFSGGFYPFVWDYDGGRNVLGVGGFYGGWHGSTHPDDFQFHGDRWVAGVKGKHYDWNGGWDVNALFGYGQYSSRGESADGDYESHRFRHAPGYELGFNYWDRQRRGERWGAKTQFWINHQFPLGGSDKHSFQGQPLDPKLMGLFKGVISVGLRQYVYDFDSVRTFCGVDWFSELPSSGSLGVNCGITDKREIFYLWAGPSFNLDRGGVAGLWTVGMDAGNAIRWWRKSVRQDAWLASLESNGIKYDPETGAFTLPEDAVDPKTKTVTPSQRKEAL